MTEEAAEVGEQLAAVLGGRVTSLRRLSGGASRITSAFDLEAPTGEMRTLVLQQVRGTGLAQSPGIEVEASLLRLARRAGVPVPEVVAAGIGDGLDAGWLVVERLDGEAIPRRIFRDERFAVARAALTGQTARALAAIHSIDPLAVPGLPRADPLHHPLEFLDALGEVRPVLELGARWLARGELSKDGPESGESGVVHGDFRMGNRLVDERGLCGVLDWELAHIGNPAEDIGWLCARAWRFGGRGRVGGFGDLDQFLAAYAAADGRAVDLDHVRWWEAYAAVKWAVICLLQASAHLSGATRSVELAAIGRRVCESEWDLLSLMGVGLPQPARVVGGKEPSASGGWPSRTSPLFGRPSLVELVEAVREYVETKVMGATGGSAQFEARVARNVLAMVGRELELGHAGHSAHAERLRTLGARDDAELAGAIRAGRYDNDLSGLGAVLAEGVLDELLVANPAYLEDQP